MHELPIQLKDAGFPQEGKNNTFLFGYNFRGGEPTTYKLQTWDEHCADPQYEAVVGKLYVPTLEELIEACGEEFADLKLLPASKGWACERQLWGENMTPDVYFGSTPTEAVAKLWLALNAK
jgi:hypothetical protein